MPRDLCVFGACEHNLQNIDVRIPRNSLTVITGLSGSGKSSLAFDTIYAEGQRRYVESLSAYARQFLDQMPKPHVEHIEGLSPAISIEQKTVSRNPRSTVGTVTEVYDFLRLLYANVGTPRCPHCNRGLERQSLADIIERVMALPIGTRLLIMAPIVRQRKGEYNAEFQRALKDGIVRAKVDGELVELDPKMRLKRSFKHDISLVLDRFVVRRDAENEERLRTAIGESFRRAEGFVSMEPTPGSDGRLPDGLPWTGERLFSQSLACPEHGPQDVELAPRLFSFNSASGWCPQCQGLGTVPEVDLGAIVPNPQLSINQGAVVPLQHLFVPQAQTNNWNHAVIVGLGKLVGFSLDKPWKSLSPAAHDAILNGIGERKAPARLTMKDGEVQTFQATWEGLLPRIRKQLHEAADDEERARYEAFLRDAPCPHCQGARLRPEALAVTLGGRNISQVCQMTLGEAKAFFDDLTLDERQSKIAHEPLKEVRERLGFLLDVGLHYLTLDRHAGTLSGGEAQRIRLATQIGTQLTGVLYILDEPSIGLHQRDNERLIGTLCKLRDNGNTVLVVEHDEQTIRTADHVVDMGPGAGRLGGKVMADGSPEELMRSESLTAQYLSGAKSIPVPTPRRPMDVSRVLKLKNATLHNLKGVDLEIPLGLMVAVTGVSGSGKSSLIVETLVPALSNALMGTSHRCGPHSGIDGLEHLDKIIDIDQAPIGRTPRSNPATYTKVFDLIRDLFASTPEAKMRGYDKGRFSFNVKGGRCEECGGDGLRRIEMHFLPDVYVTCEACNGRRYNRETLEVTYRGKCIADVLDMTIDEALEYFSAVPSIARSLQTLSDVGLGYITLGQQATTFSGGEAQRIKLSKELARRNTGKTMYVLDEPTTGLHFEDVKHLLDVLNRLVDSGSTVVIIEHHLDVIKACDWVIEVGPEGGAAGGRITHAGTPEHIAKSKGTETGRFLAPMLKVKPTDVSEQRAASVAAMRVQVRAINADLVREQIAQKKEADKASKKAAKRATTSPKVSGMPGPIKSTTPASKKAARRKT